MSSSNSVGSKINKGELKLEAPRLDIARATRRRSPWQLVGVAVILLMAALLVQLFVTNERFGWGTVAKYMFSAPIMSGLVITLGLTVVAMLLGVALGVLLAICKISSNPLLQGAAGIYIWFFRGTPLLVQLILFYNLSALLPELSFGIPFGPQFFSVETNVVVTPMLVAILGLGLHEAAYMAEIVRGGLISVDSGQREAGQSVGMSGSRIMRRIILPQAMRFIIPPTGNQVISMLKATSLVSVIAMSDLFYSVQSVYNRTFQTIPLLLVAVIWYLILTSVLNVAQSFIEQHYSKGTKRESTNLWNILIGSSLRRSKNTVGSHPKAANVSASIGGKSA